MVRTESDSGSPSGSTRVRSSAACDACRTRKVKCVFPKDVTRCTSCEELSVECTSIQPRQRRGPKNRYLKALRSQLEDDLPLSNLSGSSPSQYPLLAPSSEAVMPALENIAPRPVLDQMIQDWFDWIHPVAPIFHRSILLSRLSSSATTTTPDPGFLALIASICAATSASLRRRRELYQSVTMETCLAFARHLGIWDHCTPVTLDWCLTMYNFSSAAYHEYGLDSALTHRLSADAAIGPRFLLTHQFDGLSFMDQQILKRLYWLLFAGQCTTDIHSRPMLWLHLAHEHTRSLIPLDLSDHELLSECSYTTDNALKRVRSYIPGLNALSQLFLVWQSSQGTPAKTIPHLQEHINQLQRIMADLPPELTWTSGPSSPASTGDMAQRNFGTIVQTVNLKITQLHIRSNLLEQMNGLAKRQSMLVTPMIIVDERVRVVDELLDLLCYMPVEVFDANGYSVVPKIRDIGSALLDDLRTGDRSLDGTVRVSLKLDLLLSKLQNLDVCPTGPSPTQL